MFWKKRKPREPISYAHASAIALTTLRNSEGYGRRYRDGVVHEAALRAAGLSDPGAVVDTISSVFRKYRISDEVTV